MKLISWNVNGVRAAINKGFVDYFTAVAPDVLCLQETKARPEQVTTEMPAGYHAYWNSAEKKGYSGVATFTKEEPLSVRYGMGIDEHDSEGRVLTIELRHYFVVNVYTPNAQNELRRLPYRLEWDAAFRGYLKMLEQSKPVISCGDFNVAHKEIDIARPKSNRNSAGFSDEERASFTDLLNTGLIDTFREFNQEPHQYSWWSYRAGARGKNVGWRLDYFLASEALKPNLKDAFIQQEILGSDHCPIGLVLTR